jgi:hypothetical protein
MLVRAEPNALRRAKETQIVDVVFKIVKIGVGFRQGPNFRSLVRLFGIKRLYELADKILYWMNLAFFDVAAELDPSVSSTSGL